MDEIYTIEAKLISDTEKSWYLDCEGDKVHFPKSRVEFDAKKEVIFTERNVKVSRDKPNYCLSSKSAVGLLLYSF